MLKWSARLRVGVPLVSYDPIPTTTQTSSLHSTGEVVSNCLALHACMPVSCMRRETLYLCLDYLPVWLIACHRRAYVEY